MALPLLIRQEMMAQDQLEEWSEQMMATAPISRWIDNLNHLFEVWHDDYGVRFTDESYDEILLWMAGRQKAAWAALGDSDSSQGSPDSDLVELNLVTLEVTDPKAGRQISHEELKAQAEEKQAATTPPGEPDTPSESPPDPDDDDQMLAMLGGETNIVIVRGKTVIWTTFFPGPTEHKIGRLDPQDRRFVLVHPRFGGGSVLLAALAALADRANFSGANDGIGIRPEKGIRVIIDALKRAQKELLEQERKEEEERQKRVDEAIERIEDRGGLSEREKGARVGFDFPELREILTGPIDPRVREQLRRARRREGKSLEPVFVTPPAKQISEEEARFGTDAEIASAIRRELRQIIKEERGPLDQVQLALDALGLAPGLGIPADLLSGSISAARGDKVGASLALVSIAVDAAGVASILRKLAVRLDKLKISAGKIRKVRGFADELDRGDALRKAGLDVLQAIDNATLTREAAIATIQNTNRQLTAKQAADALDAALDAARATERSGLQIIFRRGMPVRFAKGTKGRRVPIYGNSASASTTPGHAETIDRAAERMAASGDYSHIVIGDRSLRTATGLEEASRRRPDIIGIRNNGKVDAFEVPSTSDKAELLKIRLNEAKLTLPEDLRGRFRILRLGES